MAKLSIKNYGRGLTLHIEAESKEESDLLIDFSFPDDKLITERCISSKHEYACIKITKEIL